MFTTSMAIFSNPLFATCSVYARNASIIPNLGWLPNLQINAGTRVQELVAPCCFCEVGRWNMSGTLRNTAPVANCIYYNIHIFTTILWRPQFHIANLQAFSCNVFENLSRDWFLSWLTACHSATCLRDFWCTFHIPRYVIDLVRFLAVCSREENQGRSDGVYRYIYPQNQSTLKKFMWLFFSCDPEQIRYDICSRVGH